MYYWDRNSSDNFLAAIRYRVSRDAGPFVPTDESLDAVVTIRQRVIAALRPLVAPVHICRQTALAWLSRRTYTPTRTK